MRKQINGLVLLVQEKMKLSPFETALFVFCNGQRRLLKAVYWDRTGFCLWMKRLEKGRFPWPRTVAEAGQGINVEQLRMVLMGIDFWSAHEELKYTGVAESFPGEAEQDKQCACGHPLVCIGEDSAERIDVIPPQIQVIRTVRPKYACHHCEGSGDEARPAVRVAPTPPALIPKGLASEGLLAFIATAKFCDALPLYRQERQFARLGIELSRRTMSDWMIAAAAACEPAAPGRAVQPESGPGPVPGTWIIPTRHGTAWRCTPLPAVPYRLCSIPCRVDRLPP